MILSTMRQRLPLFILASLMLALSIAPAGSSLAATTPTSGQPAYQSGTNQSVAAPDDASAKARSRQTNIVNISVVDDAFSPRQLTVEVGTTIVWTNNGVRSHTVSGGTFESGNLRPGGVFTYTFTVANTSNYICEYHVDSSNMRGTVVVNPSSATPTATVPVGSPTPTICPNPFTDINGNVFASAIGFLYCRGVVNGTSPTTYNPSGNSLRSEFAKIVVRGFGIAAYTPTSGQTFSDVSPSHPFFTSIEAAVRAGIINGFPANICAANNATFPCYLPNSPINRGQLTRMVVGAAGYTIFTPTSPSFSDVPPSHPFYGYIETAVNKGVVQGYPDNTFRPANPVQRDEMAQIVYRGITTP